MRMLAAIFVLFSITLHAAERLTATGTVVDETTKQPVGNATVLVHAAGVRTGYDQYCPTCYVDCGKRATADADGKFTISGLSPDLLFTLLVVRDGYSSAFIKKHDPKMGPASAALKHRPQPPDPRQVVRGKVVDTMGKPVREALIAQQGVIFDQGRRFGDMDWIDLVAVSNREGQFEMAYSKPVTGMILEVTPRGMAPLLTTLNTGVDRHTVVVRDGATIRGRLVSNGKPVANAEMILNTHSRFSGTIFKDILIGTNEAGEFAITNVPAGRIWDLAARMESLAPRGLTTSTTYVETKDDGQEVNAGEIEARPAHVVRGRVVLSDGKPIPADMRVSIGSDRGVDRQVLVLPPDGTFEFKGLDKGVYSLQPAVRGYRVRNSEFGVELLIQGNRDNVVVTLDPVKPQAK